MDKWFLKCLVAKEVGKDRANGVEFSTYLVVRLLSTDVRMQRMQSDVGEHL